jgi:hypothetical protein
MQSRIAVHVIKNDAVILETAFSDFCRNPIKIEGDPEILSHGLDITWPCRINDIAVTINQNPPYTPQANPEQPTASDEEWRRQQRKNWRRQLCPQWTMVVITGGGVIVAAFTIGILNETLKATQIAADAAKTQATAAKQAIELAEKTLRQDQRAWVGVKEITFRGQVRPGSELFAVIQVQNTGKTPALEVAIENALTFKKPTKESLAGLPKIGPFAKIAIAPNNIFIAIQMFGQGDIEKLESSIAYIYGKISYKDVFDGEHETWFCSYYRRDFFPALRFCDTLNYMN